ncbi:MAG: hypothetical protein J6K89_08615 [Oscillospiraceae bacterium]|nr:hypothetical protein [Oscillospiraceae bacterium]
MGLKRKLTADELQEKVEEYFNSISYEVPLVRKETIMKKTEDGSEQPVLDQYGHESYRYVRVKLKNGEKASSTVWTEPPSVIGLSLYLGVDRTTLFRWKNPPEGKSLSNTEKRFCNILTRAWGRIEAYLIARTEEGKAARGAIANLEANFGWRQRREVGLSTETTEAIKETAVLTSTQKIAELRKLGLRLPWDEPDERTGEKEEENDQQ